MAEKRKNGSAIRIPKTSDSKPLDKDRASKIARIKKEVANGTYSIDTREVAKAVVDKTVNSSKKK